MVEVTRGKILAEEVVQYLVSHGVPRGIATQKQISVDDCAELLTRIEKDTATKVAHPIGIKQQVAGFKRTLADPLERPYTLAISGETSDRLPSAVALMIFKEALRRPNIRFAPYWHQLDGSPKDSLRDGLPLARPPNLLVISNLATNSTMMKLEKVRDLLAEYAHVPRIVVASGGNPAALFANTLFKQADRFMFYGFKEGE